MELSCPAAAFYRSSTKWKTGDTFQEAFEIWALAERLFTMSRAATR